MRLNNKQTQHSGSFSKYFGLFLSFAILVVVIIGVVKKQAISDWWKLKDYTPPSSISALADETTMTAKARKLFYVSHPKIEAAKAFNDNCKVAKEKTIVLGCYIGGTSQKIYIFNVTDSRLNGVEEVTAAHETLHAAYDRMSNSQKAQVDALIKIQMKKLKNDDHLQTLIQIYNKQEPGELYNEMHSILGTEYGNLSPALEHYYSQYFTNRQTVVGYANGYKKVFNQMKNQLTQNEQLLRDLKSQVDNLSSSIDSQKVTLNSKSAQLNSLRSNNTQEYNNQVPVYNALVNKFNQTVAQYKDLTNQYNDLVKSHNQIAIDYNSLNNELDSKYKPVGQQN